MEGYPNKSKPEKRLGGRIVPDRESFRETEREMNRRFLDDQAECKARHPETFGAIETIIDSIDLSTLKDVFEEYAQKSGVEARRMNFAPREHIFISDNGMSPNHRMDYVALSNSIRINAVQFEDLLAHEDREAVRAECLKDIVHEYTHATGAIRYAEEASPDMRYATLKRASGMDADFSSTNPSFQPEGSTYASVRVFELFNEGVTERISHEVLLEYLRRTDSKTLMDRELAEDSIVHDIGTDTTTYGQARHIAMALTTALSKQIGVPEEVIWRGFVRQYYSGEMRSDELMDLLDESFGSDFGRSLMNAKNGADLRNLAEQFPAISAEKPDIALRWLSHLEIARGAK